MSEIQSWLFYKYWQLSTNILIFDQQVFHKSMTQVSSKHKTNFKHIQQSQVIVFFSTKYEIELFHQVGAVIEARMGGARVTAGPCPYFRTL